MKEFKRVASILVLILIAGIIVVILTAATPVVEVDNSTETIETQVETEVTVEETKQEPIIIIDYASMPGEQKYCKCFVNARTSEDMSNNNDTIIIPRGTEVKVLGQDGGWARVWIEGENREHYIWSEYLLTKEEWEDYSSVPYSAEVPLSQDLQKYLWNECQDTGTDYCFALAIIDRETGGTFNPNIISKTHDYGLMQCNRCWKSTFKKLGFIQESMEELLNPYNSIHAGLYLLSQYVAEYGPSEAAAFKYNTGHSGGSNAYARDVFNNKYPKWKSIVYPEVVE